MRSLFVQVKLKLISELSQWRPSQENSKALSLLRPWNNVLEAESFENILNRCIVPKLSKEIGSLEIDPSD